MIMCGNTTARTGERSVAGAGTPPPPPPDRILEEGVEGQSG